MRTFADIKAMIRGLLELTVDRGASEAEAMAAAEKARLLMRKHRLEIADIEAEPVVTEAYSAVRRGTVSSASQLMTAVGAYCDCQAWIKSATRTPVFTGRESDMMFATWLLDALDGFCARAVLNYVANAPMSQRKAHLIESFRLGLVCRINDRLREATAQRPRAERAAAATRNALALKEQGIGPLRAGAKQRPNVKITGAYHAGRAAGDGAGFSRPVHGGARVMQIGA